MSQAAFRLVETTEIPDVFRFERRASPRHSAHGRATVVCTTEINGQRHRRITSVDLQDISPTGMGVICADELTPDTRVAILMPPHGTDHGFDQFGQVVRCQAIDGGYRIGIKLDAIHSAVA